MKNSSYKFRLLPLVLLGVLSPYASGQVGNPSAVTVPVEYHVEYYGDSSQSYIDAAFADGFVQQYGVHGYGTTPREIANMKPGKTHLLKMYGDDIDGFDVHFDPPSGYVIFVEKVERRILDYPYYVDQFDWVEFEIVVHAAPSLGAKMGIGQMSSLQPGAVTYQIGLGSLRSGKPAGAISARSSDIGSSSFSRSSLLYDTPNPNEVLPYKDSGGLRQIYTNHALVDIQNIGGTEAFEVEFYKRTDVTGSGFPYGTSPGAVPFVTYRIENPNGTGGYDKIRVKKTVGSTTWETLLHKVSSSSWKLDDWHKSGQPVLRKDERTYSGTSPQVETVTIKDGSGNVATKVVNEYEIKSWGKELVKSTAGSDLPHYTSYTNREITKYTYHENSSYKGDYRKVKSIIYPDGNWEQIDYFDDVATEGQVKTIYRPWLDSPATPQAVATQGDVTSYTYQADWTGKKTLVKTEVRKINNTTVSDITYNYTYPTIDLDHDGALKHRLQLIVIEKQEKRQASGATLVSKVKMFRDDEDAEGGFYQDLIYSVVHEDGTVEAHAYVTGVWMHTYQYLLLLSDGSDRIEVVIHGGDPNGTEGSLISHYGNTEVKQDIEPLRLIEGQSTMKWIIRDSQGNIGKTMDHVWTGSDWELVEGQDYDRDAFSQPTKVQRLLRNFSTSTQLKYSTLLETTYVDGLLTSHTDAMGVVTEYQYDGMNRVTVETKKGVGANGSYMAQSDLRTEYSYDAEGRRTSKLVGPSGSNKIEYTWQYDTAGRKILETRPGSDGSALQTAFDYKYGLSGGVSQYRRKTTTFPDGTKSVQWWYLDGQLWQVSGEKSYGTTGRGTNEAGVYQRYDYTLDSTTGFITERYQNDDSSSDGMGWRRRIADWSGRTIEEIVPTSTVGVDRVEKTDYNAKGQPSKISLYRRDSSGETLLLSPTILEFGGQGALKKTGVDIDQNSALASSGSDRIIDYGFEVVTDSNGDLWHRATRHGYIADGLATRVKLSDRLTRITGLSEKVFSEVREVDPTTEWNDSDVNQTVIREEVDRSGKLSYRYYDFAEAYDSGNSTYANDGFLWDSRIVKYNGAVVEETEPGDVAALYEYDSYGRLAKEEGRSDVELNYNYATYGIGGGVTRESTLIASTSNKYVTLAEYSYNAGGLIERIKQTNYVDGATRDEIAYYAYNGFGQMTHQWGNAVQPIAYEYNDYGFMSKMKTYRDDYDGNSSTNNFNGASWPSVSDSNAGITQWAYQSETGLLLSKVYDNGKSVDFEYNERGQLSKRIWARENAQGERIHSAYSYYEAGDSGVSKGTGALKKIEYNDGTASVEYQYYRHGALKKAKDASGWHDFAYRSNDLQLSSVTSDYLADKPLTYYYEYPTAATATSVEGRLAGLRYASSSVYDVDYQYENSTGRLSTVVWTPANKTVHYDYLANSNMVDNVKYAASWQGSDFFEKRTYYQSWRNLPDVIENRWDTGGGIINRASYTYDYDWASC